MRKTKKPFRKCDSLTDKIFNRSSFSRLYYSPTEGLIERSIPEKRRLISKSKRRHEKKTF